MTTLRTWLPDDQFIDREATPEDLARHGVSHCVKTFVRLLQPDQRFTLLRSGVDYTFVRRVLFTPSGVRYIVRNEKTQQESTLHHSCCVQMKDLL